MRGEVGAAGIGERARIAMRDRTAWKVSPAALSARPGHEARRRRRIQEARSVAKRSSATRLRRPAPSPPRADSAETGTPWRQREGQLVAGIHGDLGGAAPPGRATFRLVDGQGIEFVGQQDRRTGRGSAGVGRASATGCRRRRAASLRCRRAGLTSTTCMRERTVVFGVVRAARIALSIMVPLLLDHELEHRRRAICHFGGPQSNHLAHIRPTSSPASARSGRAQRIAAQDRAVVGIVEHSAMEVATASVRRGGCGRRSRRRAGCVRRSWRNAGVCGGVRRRTDAGEEQRNAQQHAHRDADRQPNGSARRRTGYARNTA